MELFDKQFVRFMWDDELEGKKCFVADSIVYLIEGVAKGTATYVIHWSGAMGMPFERDDGVRYRFAYFDPNYGVKKAFNEGKKIQVLFGDKWEDIDNEEQFERCLEIKYTFRIKPDGEKKWIAYLARLKNGHCYLTACIEDKWEDAQKDCGAKTKLFVGDGNEVEEWYRPRQKFAPLIKDWEDGKKIQFKASIGSWFSAVPDWDPCLEYRVDPEKKKYRPYKDANEMIEDFMVRFKVNCPSYAEPLVWVKGKHTDTRFLILAFYETFIKFNDDEPFMFKELFEGYTYLDGSPCGMEVKE